MPELGLPPPRTSFLACKTHSSATPARLTGRYFRLACIRQELEDYGGAGCVGERWGLQAEILERPYVPHVPIVPISVRAPVVELMLYIEMSLEPEFVT